MSLRIASLLCLASTLFSLEGPILPTCAAAETWFGSPVEYSTGNGPSGIGLGDLNNDGIPDLVTAGHMSDSISTLLGVGDGSFGTHADTYVPGFHFKVAVGHLNADLFADVAVTSWYLSTVSVLLGNGDGTFGTPADLPTGSFPETVAIRDLNSDSKNDLVVVNTDDPGSVTVYLGNGDGTFGPRTDFGTWRGPRGLDIGDLDGDTKLDLVVANSGVNTTEHSVSILLGNGDGTFKTHMEYGTSMLPVSVAIGSLNGDAYPDLVTVGQFDSLSVLPGTGAGVFGPYVNRSVPYVPNSVSVADFDIDGKADLSIVREGLSGVSIYPGNGDGTFGMNSDLLTGIGTSPRSQAVGDLNGDGRTDLAVAIRGYPEGGFGGTTVMVFLNCVPCTPTAVSVTLVEAEFARGAVHLRWTTPRASGEMFGKVQRRTGGTDWVDLGGPYPLRESDFTYEDTSVPSGERVGYRLELWDSVDRWYSEEAWVSVPSEAGVPRTLTFRAPRPSPSDGNVRFAIGLPAAGHVRLRIFNVSGRQVATVADHERGPGWTVMGWDGRDSSGRPVSGGVYWARLESSSQRISRKFVVAR